MTSEQLKQFRLKAIQQGYSPQEIQDYLSSGDSFEDRKALYQEKQKVTTSRTVSSDTRDPMTKVGDVLNGIFGGKKIGEGIGTAIANRTMPSSVNYGGRVGEVPLERAKGPNTKELLGDIAGAALTVGTVAGKPTLLAGRAAAGAVAKTTGKTVLGSVAKNTALGASFGAAGAMKENKDLRGIAKGAATGAATLGVLAGAGTAAKLGVQKAAQGAQKAAPGIFRSGLGFSKNVMKQEERAGKSAADILIKEGGGSADKLRIKYQTGLDASEKEIQRILGSSTKKYKSQSIIDKVTSTIQREYKNTLNADEVKQIVDTLPMAKLKSKKILTIGEVNEVKREINKRFLSNTKWLQEKPSQNVAAIRTLYDTLAQAVKSGEKSTIPIFTKQSAYIKGIEGLINQGSTTNGPLNTAARVGAPLGSAAIGAMVGGVPGAVAGVVGEEVVRTTAFKTYLATSLKGAGLAVDNLSESEVTKLGELLIKLGVIKNID